MEGSSTGFNQIPFIGIINANANSIHWMGLRLSIEPKQTMKRRNGLGKVQVNSFHMALTIIYRQSMANRSSKGNPSIINEKSIKMELPSICKWLNIFG